MISVSGSHVMPNSIYIRMIFFSRASLKKYSIGRLSSINSLFACFFPSPERKISMRMWVGAILLLCLAPSFAQEAKPAVEKTAEQTIEQAAKKQLEPINEQQSINDQQRKNLKQQKQLNETQNPGVEFDPSEDISEDTSVPFPVDI